MHVCVERLSLWNASVSLYRRQPRGGGSARPPHPLGVCTPLWHLMDLFAGLMSGNTAGSMHIPCLMRLLLGFCMGSYQLMHTEPPMHCLPWFPALLDAPMPVLLVALLLHTAPPPPPPCSCNHTTTVTAPPPPPPNAHDRIMASDKASRNSPGIVDH